MKLNIGCSVPTGKYKRGWINMDLVKHEHMNLIGSGLAIPLRDNSIELIHCVHVLEHVTRDKNDPMLKELARVLKPGGQCFIEVPDFKMTVIYLSEAFKKQDTRKIHNMTTSIYGKNERPGMAHYWGFTEELLSQKMIGAGFYNIKRSQEMISDHYTQEPVLLMMGIK